MIQFTESTSAGITSSAKLILKTMVPILCQKKGKDGDPQTPRVVGRNATCDAL